MIRSLLARFRGVIFGLFFGFGLAVLFVTWRDDAFYGELFVCRMYHNVRIEQTKKTNNITQRNRKIWQINKYHKY